MLRLHKYGKLEPIFFGLVEILDKKGPVAYELALPSHVKVHNVFHASLQNKYVYDTKHVTNWSLLQVEPEGQFMRNPLHILDKREVQLRKQSIVQLKVQWRHFGLDEATWENETTMKQVYLTFFHDFISSPQNTETVLF